MLTNGLDAVVRIHACLASPKPGWGARTGDSIDCVVMDCNMPYLTGNEATLLVRAMAHWHPFAEVLPILGATAHGTL